ncbi:hypothetical protein V6Z11_D06G026000 [Gossypium hirsutum]
MHVIPMEHQQRFFSDTFQVWLSYNLCCHIRLQDRGITWSCLFGLIAWRIWKNRNPFIFQNVTWSAIEIVEGILDVFLVLLNKRYRRATIQTNNPDMVQALSDIRLEDLGIIVVRMVQ